MDTTLHPLPPRPAAEDHSASSAPLAAVSFVPVCGAREENVRRRLALVAELLARAQQRQIRVEMSATRIRLRLEQRVQDRVERESHDAEAAERAWLRAEARSMLATGWTPQELREIGFAEWLPHRK